MRHTRVKAVNFLSHSNTELNLDGIDSLVALGPNGSGKSSLLVDSFLLAAFGKGRKIGEQKRSDMDAYIRNGTDLMTIERDFIVGQEHYRIILKRSIKTARGSTALQFLKIDSHGNKTEDLTKGSIDETREAIIKTIGTDFDTLVRTSILEQGEANAFLDATPAGRMELVLKIWDLDRYKPMSEMARDVWTEKKAKITVLEEKIAGAKVQVQEIAKKNEELAGLKKELEKETAAIAPLEKKRDDLQKKIGGLETITKDLETARSQKSRAEQDIKTATGQLEEVLKKTDRFHRILKNQDVVRAKVKEEVEKNVSIEAAEGELNIIIQGIEDLRKQTDLVRAEYAVKLEEIEEQKSGLEAEIKGVNSLLDALTPQLSSLARKEEELKHLEGDSKKLFGIACHPDYDPTYINKTCRFIKDAVVAKGKLPWLQADIDAERKRIGSETTTLKERMSQFEAQRQTLLSMAGEIKNGQASAILEIADKVSGRTMAKTQAKAKVEALKTDLIEIRRFTRLLPEIDLAEREMPGLKKENDRLSGRCDDLERDRKKFEGHIKKLTESLTSKDKLASELQFICKSLEEASARKEETTKKLAVVGADIARREQTKKEITGDEKSIEDLAGDKALYQILEEALRQIPYMLVSRSIKAVEAIANEMLAICSSTGQAVEIDTEKQTKTTNNIRNEIHLAYRDNEGPKKILSGGEKDRMAVSLRLGFSEVLAHRRGVRIDSLIADEPFGPLDVEGIEDMKEALKELKKKFRFMGIITHIESAKDVFPTKLIFSKGPTGSSVEISEEA